MWKESFCHYLTLAPLSDKRWKLGSLGKFHNESHLSNAKALGQSLCKSLVKGQNYGGNWFQTPNQTSNEQYKLGFPAAKARLVSAAGKPNMLLITGRRQKRERLNKKRFGIWFEAGRWTLTHCFKSQMNTVTCFIYRITSYFIVQDQQLKQPILETTGHVLSLFSLVQLGMQTNRVELNI